MKSIYRELSLNLSGPGGIRSPTAFRRTTTTATPRLAGMLERGESQEAIAGELERIRMDAMGVDRNREADLTAADLLRIWFDERDRA